MEVAALIVAILAFIFAGAVLLTLLIACRREYEHFRRITKTLITLRDHVGSLIKMAKNEITTAVESKIKKSVIEEARTAADSQAKSVLAGLIKQIEDLRAENKTLRDFLNAKIKESNLRHEHLLRRLGQDLEAVEGTSSRLIKRLVDALAFWRGKKKTGDGQENPPKIEGGIDDIATSP